MSGGGVMDSVNATSFEKMVIDFEIIRQVKAAFTPIEVNEETLNLEEIKEIGHDGSFITADYTLENFSDLYSPRVGPRSAADPDYFMASVDAEMQRLLEVYEEEAPALDETKLSQVKAILERSGAHISL